MIGLTHFILVPSILKNSMINSQCTAISPEYIEPGHNSSGPSNVIPINDYQLDIQIGRIYSAAGDNASLEKRLKNIQNKNDLDLQTHFYLAQIYINDLKDFKFFKNLDQ